MDSEKRIKVALMMPSRDVVVSLEHSNSIVRSLNWLGAAGYDATTVTIVGMGSPPVARCHLIARAMAWGADKLVFVDDDIAWSVPQLQRLVEDPAPFITGAYVLKPQSQNYDKLYMTVGKIPKDKLGQDVIVDKAGFGFMRCDRLCIIDLIDYYKPPALHNISMPDEANRWYYDMFPFDHEPHEESGRNKLLTADVTFVKRLAEIGYPCKFHTDLIVPHMQGPIAWMPRMEDVVE